MALNFSLVAHNNTKLATFLLPTILLVFAHASRVTAQSNNSTTFVLPPGYSDHGDQHLLCRPTRWTDVAIFFLGNYAAHAATVKTRPGENPIQVILTVTTALLFPTSGVLRAISSASSLAVFAKTELRCAARAGALCTVAYYPESTVDLSLTRVHGFCCSLPPGFGVVRVPGDAEFFDDPDPEQQTLFRILWDPIHSLFKPAPPQPIRITSNYSLLKALVAVAQALFGIATLYNTRGDQIQRYGYAAFGLTVTPYAYMSVINLLANLLCPEYPSMYLVESQAMRDAEKELAMSLASTATGELLREPNSGTTRGQPQQSFDQQPEEGKEPSPTAGQTIGQPREEKPLLLLGETASVHESSNPPHRPFTSIIGVLDYDWDKKASLPRRGKARHDVEGGGGQLHTTTTSSSHTNLQDQEKLNTPPICWARYLSITVRVALRGILWLAGPLLPVAVVGALSSFHKGASSTHAQRVWTMTWLAFGILIGMYADNAVDTDEWDVYLPRSFKGWGLVVVALTYGAPAVGGFVVVAQMLLEYGICFKII